MVYWVTKEIFHGLIIEHFEVKKYQLGSKHFARNGISLNPEEMHCSTGVGFSDEFSVKINK
jgi:hypothetical protein